MNEIANRSVSWETAALQAVTQEVSTLGSPIECLSCHALAVLAEWHTVDLLPKKVSVDLRCSSCGVSQEVEVELPNDVLECFPPERITMATDAIKKRSSFILERLRVRVAKMPIAVFTTSSLWDEARWSGTTFQWDQAGEKPPLMGIKFENDFFGRKLFSELVRQQSNVDRFEELRISIVEGSSPGLRNGYSIHFCPDPDGLAAYATAQDVVLDPQLLPLLSRWNRSFPNPGSPPLLKNFKREFAKHKQFMLAPVVRRPDGLDWIDHEVGIIKRTIEFRDLSDIKSPDDPDAAAAVMQHLIVPKQ